MRHKQQLLNNSIKLLPTGLRLSNNSNSTTNNSTTISNSSSNLMGHSSSRLLRQLRQLLPQGNQRRTPTTNNTSDTNIIMERRLRENTMELGLLPLGHQIRMEQIRMVSSRLLLRQPRLRLAVLRLRPRQPQRLLLLQRPLEAVPVKQVDVPCQIFQLG